ncbi:Sialic acid synthase [Salinibacter ruber M8]|jgi:N-acetylneuraminate synthase|uniref:Sialic acid synthase n=1 Tax=Salinibacter ruber (strain M8) TaxID=761659 RepID=D5H6G5_SALRM|nr:N-acetylneuraminate synthase family protein [Salinibacter ruber]CBH23620.1 Sialic acid synthase [Salinibacter ruber M8]
MNTVDLGPANVGGDNPPFIVAEIGSNHNGDMDLCRDIIDAAVGAGADAVKFQSWTEETLISEEEYQRNTEYENKKKHFGTLREMVREYQLTPDQHHTIQEYCQERDITFCSSVFSEQEADLLEDLDVPFYKIASMDINNLPLLDYVAHKGRPMIVSTGMATMAEIEQAVHTIQEAGNDEIVLLHCVSVYPPDMDLMNLRNMETLQTAFDVPVGFSDHTLGTSIPLAAIARGACVVEKHFTIDKDLPGWDHAISSDPEEMETLATEGKRIQRALGSSVRTVSQEEHEKRKQFRRSAIAQKPLAKGETLRSEDIAFKRPGNGIGPDEFEYAEGRKVAKSVKEGHVVHWHHLSGEGKAEKG